MPSLKDRMAAFKAASAPESFEKQRTKTSAADEIKTTKNKFAGKKSFTPTVTPEKSSSPSGKKVSPGKPGKLSAATLSAASSFGKPGGGSSSSFGGSNTVTPVKKGKVVENKPTPPSKDGPKDWNFLYELSVSFDNYKAAEADAKKSSAASRPAKSSVPEEPQPKGPKKDIKSALEGVFGGQYTAKADWLNNKWIDEHLQADKKYSTLTFRLGDPRLFGRFDKTDKANQDAIINKLVTTLLGHPQGAKITGLDLSNCLLPDEFLEVLAEKVLANPSKGLPQLHVLNLETNLIQGPGFQAIAKVIKDENSWKYLQVLMIENQKKPHTSDAEEELADAIAWSQSLAVVSFRARGGLQRQQINNTVAANIDNLRQARRNHAAKTGTLKARKRNEMEQYFDKIAANDASITAVDIVGDAKFLSLKNDEKTKAGTAFATNSNVKTVKLVKLQLDDKFAKAIGEALATNSTIEKLILDSNTITGDGIKSIFAGVANNSTITELQLRHQSKTMSSSDEDALPTLLEANKTIIKLGVDARNQLVKMKLDRQTNANREHQRKLRAQAKKG